MSSLTVALVQMDIQWLDTSANLSHLDQLLDSKKLETVDLVVLPETFATGFGFDQPNIGEIENGPILNWMLQTATRTNTIVAGSVAVNCEDKNANRLYWAHPDGKVECYDKRHLFRMGNEHQHVVAGKQRKVLNIKGFRILPLVCYDLRFPVWSRNCNDYDIMVNVANWPAARRKVWDTLLQARAMENQCYVLGVNRIGKDGKGTDHSGGTAIYDFKGDTLAAAPDNQSQLLIHTLEMAALNQFKQQFPAHLDGDQFELTEG